ncbi:MAG: hypothetical protein ACU837_03160 [Gammaproteobacteria bacterium]
MMRNLWDPVMNLVANQNQSHMRNKQVKQPIKAAKEEINSIKAILSALPHALLMTRQSSGNSLWSSLEEEHLKINSDDITLKHGSNFAGHWYVLGILDAKPDNGIESITNHHDIANDLIRGMTEMLNMTREFLGRPRDAYGITPIAIFRSVSRI